MSQLTNVSRFLMVAVLSVLGCIPVASAASGGAQSFDAAKAFCERQTFVLEKLDEVKPWLDYFSGLRNGRSPAPDAACDSSTVRAILNIVGSGDMEKAKDSRSSFFAFYVARAMEPELADRRMDTDRSFRYRNDIVLASFVWLLCPGHADHRSACLKENVEAFPAEFLKTSPVFCDFAEGGTANIEWPPNPAALPLMCAGAGNSSVTAQNSWLKQATIILGD
ncbi:hypothetical protein [Rhizobium paknamense]|uniref:Uncharacterized protein n=1 Tax=Rhizobium paknamense TaxID=1206817 RepID=A0ABU0IIJ2_9HYPH|nr:hypothetical protein [Rhizobium paknamense]MDQ0458080.1 hypothetical protein [Rhizobium paknamense]